MTAPEPQAPSDASQLYKTLLATATEFVHCQDRDETQSTRMNLERVRAIRSTNFLHSFGHNTLVSANPALQGEFTVDSFLAHVTKMMSKLETWDMRISDIVVDETRKMCVVRVSYFMKPYGAEQPVENDLIWWLWIEEGGKRVMKAVEFVDGVATGRIGELLMAGVNK
ncbi:hypothetical protein SLS60_011355 [Paraconiothyrium brasiliense]|uniref:SnoaL-like domain-containing protein n=1 Tax=Paraconiothyrium brasiliense TaxID=300254 RepID=A0ABR3QK14_9PLEO